jgi:hypothetical protein
VQDAKPKMQICRIAQGQVLSGPLVWHEACLVGPSSARQIGPFKNPPILPFFLSVITFLLANSARKVRYAPGQTRPNLTLLDQSERRKHPFGKKKSMLLPSPIHFICLISEQNLYSVYSPKQFQLVQSTSNNISLFYFSACKSNLKFKFSEWIENMMPYIKKYINIFIVILVCKKDLI